MEAGLDRRIWNRRPWIVAILSKNHAMRGTVLARPSSNAPHQGESVMKNKLLRGIELLLLGAVFASGAVLVGCQEGPVEETGEEIDDALDDAGDSLN